MQSPWSRIKEYMNLLGSLQLHTPKDHPDQANISNNLNKIREIYIFIKKVVNKIN
jgi:hypothetical protein